MTKGQLELDSDWQLPPIISHDCFRISHNSLMLPSCNGQLPIKARTDRLLVSSITSTSLERDS